MYTAPALPLDVAGIIVDALGDEQDMNALKACSLASRIFVPLSRKHILSTVQINDAFSELPSPPETSNLVALLSSPNPDVPNYIRKFEFRLTEYDLEHRSLPSLLQKITKLDSLYLWSHGTEKIDWLQIPKPMRNALLHLMRLPTLTHLRLRWFQNFPVSDIAPCTNLISLNVEHVEFAEIDTPAAVSTPPKLQEYIVGDKSALSTHMLLDAVLENGNSAFDFTGLKKLNAIYEEDEDVSATERLLKDVKTLETLELFVCTAAPFQNLAKFMAQNARTLKTLNLRIHLDEGEESDPLLGLCEELEAVSDNNVVETIEMTVEVSTDTDCSTGDDWGRLDKVLNKPVWPKLKHVTLDIGIYVYSNDGEALKEALDLLPQIQLGRLADSKTVDFKFTTHIELV
ncbi:hypothetical protein B0H34DRAFT_665812 [Crassisporium funariophilum]|nr:hypothetical protein B0H34DRAFT_665812 [Crassisporium funariophilum]